MKPKMNNVDRMKHFFNHIMSALALSLMVISCAPEIMAPVPGKLPEASELEVVITADQETNYVTFSVANPGVVPIWIFGEELIDGKPGKFFAYTGNGTTLRIREAGTHKVEVKAYNSNGISIGSKMCEYTLDNTYRDPFNAAPYMKAVKGEWMWNSTVDDHFGCGENLSAPSGWWSAKANEKADWSLYNDRISFTEDGIYSFNPGEDGKVYVNAGFSALGTSPDGNDFLVDVPAYESTYTIENNWNEAGIEEIWLVLPEHKNLSYIPNQTIYDNPRFLFLNNKAADIKKEIRLAAALAPNGETTISWLYSFIPAVKVATPEEMLAGTDAAGKVWIMDKDTKGHITCGPSFESPAEWWSANPGEKASSGLYDDEITFFPDGKYIYNPGPDGKMYINWGVTLIGPNPGAEPDVDIDWTQTESTYTFDGETIILGAHTPMVYVPSDSIWENPVFKITALSETSMTVVAMNEGCYWQMIFKARDVVAAGPSINGNPLPAELSVAKGEALELTGVDAKDLWIDPDFFDANGNTLTFKAMAGDYLFTCDGQWIKVVPLVNGEKATYENGKALWIIGDGGGKPTVDNLIGWNTGDAPLPMARIAENKYQITLAMKAEGGSVKIFGQSDWGVEWTKDKYNAVVGNSYFHIPEDDGNIHTDPANEKNAGYYVFTVVDNDGILDLSVEKMKQVVLDPSDATWNMWLKMNVESISYHYAPGWAKLDDPVMVQDGNSYTITLPAASFEQWQAQFALHTNMSTSASKHYDFQCKLISNEDHPGVTIKLVLSGGGDNDNVFYFADRHPLKADEEFVYTMKDMPGIDMDKISMFFDFGGNVDNTVVTIKDILLQEHRVE